MDDNDAEGTIVGVGDRRRLDDDMMLYT